MTSVGEWLWCSLRPRPEIDEREGEEVRISEPYVEERVISLATASSTGSQLPNNGIERWRGARPCVVATAGALAADMFIAEERTVGEPWPAEYRAWSDFRDDRVSVGGGLYGGFYQWFGVAANPALTANMLIIAMMSALSATLTLPGIAGIVLTVGMAVDANVLIFSRIKEELKRVRLRRPQSMLGLIEPL